MSRGHDENEALAAFFDRRFGRRGVVKGAAGAAAVSGLAAAGTLGRNRATAASGGHGLLDRVSATYQDLPADAAPPERQIYVVPSDPTQAVVLDFYEQVYKRPENAADLFSEPLVRLNKDFEIVPGAATEWTSSEDGRTWTFTIDTSILWSDGNPLTANDWVKTFQYAAEPGRWDFSWFFAGVIKNYSEAIDETSGVTPDQIGVTAPDDQTLVFETVDPAPYLPAMLTYSLPLSKAGLEGTGPLYNTNPETAISSGPFILAEWQRDVHIIYKRNEAYSGKLVVPIQEVHVKFGAKNTHYTLYETGEVDYMQNPAPTELQLAQAATPDEIYSGVGDFRCFYLFFDVTKAPFDTLEVRQAFSHAVDRDAIQAQILGPVGRPAYSWLADGFPAANGAELAGIQNYDPARAKELLAAAGYPDGEGFPKLELWLRNENPLNQDVANATAAMLAETLGIEIEVSNKDQALFMDSLTAKPTEILFGYVSYGMDYLDPSNMLSVWKGGGRHSWANDEFDAKLQEATTYLGDPAERIALFQQAEQILVEDVPGVFVYHETPVQLIKPYLKGDALTPDKNGITSLHWPGYTTMSTNPTGLYLTDEAPERD